MKKPVTVSCDASQFGLGAVLLQDKTSLMSSLGGGHYKGERWASDGERWASDGERWASDGEGWALDGWRGWEFGMGCVKRMGVGGKCGHWMEKV